eukprot:scaffold16762_cov96-Isochrysis_galbana.AAC.1
MASSSAGSRSCRYAAACSTFDSCRALSRGTASSRSARSTAKRASSAAERVEGGRLVAGLQNGTLPVVRVQHICSRLAASELWPAAQGNEPGLRGALGEIDPPLQRRLAPQIAPGQLRGLRQNGQRTGAVPQQPSSRSRVDAHLGDRECRPADLE